MKIAVTKLEEKSEGIHDIFKRYGHEAVIVSTMRAAPPTDPTPLSKLCEMISENKIDILIFTSALGVDIFFKKLKQICVHLRKPLRKVYQTRGMRSIPQHCASRSFGLSAVYKSIQKNVRIVSVGPKTAEKVEKYGLKSEIIEKFSSDNFAQHLGDIRGKTIGIARADVPNPELIRSLSSKGAALIEAPVYRLVPGRNIAGALKDVDAVIFTSAKSFEFSGFTHDPAKRIKVIAIGKKTAEAMRKHGISPDIVGDGTLENCLARL